MELGYREIPEHFPPQNDSKRLPSMNKKADPHQTPKFIVFLFQRPQQTETHLELILVCNVRQKSIYIFSHMDIQLPQYDLLKRPSFSLLPCMLTFVINHVWVMKPCMHMWVCSIGQLSVPAPYNFDYHHFIIPY